VLSEFLDECGLSLAPLFHELELLHKIEEGSLMRSARHESIQYGGEGHFN
jgi:hypothetical protein